jgi:DNA repair protein RadD
MNNEEREQLERALGRIPKASWDELLASPEGAALASRRELVRECLREMRRLPPGAPPSPVTDLIELHGHGLLATGDLARWVRYQLLLQLAPTKWERLAARFREIDSARASSLHGNATQHGVGSEVMAQPWQRGGRWARTFCDTLELPESLAHGRDRALPDDERVEPPVALTALHDFQQDTYHALRRILGGGVGSALLSLPTGAGKTRVAVDALCDHLAGRRDARNVVLWIAQSDELLQQAWQCFRQVWGSPRDGAEVRRTGLDIVRAWGSRRIDTVEVDDGPAVVLAGIQQLHAWSDDPEALADLLPRRRLAAVVVDEAHRVITQSSREVLIALGLRVKNHWRVPANAPPVLGLTATPWRSRDAESESLRGYFERTLITSKHLGDRPIEALQERGILAKVRWRGLEAGAAPALTAAERRRAEEFGDLPPEYLARLGLVPRRNAQIVDLLLGLPDARQGLLFACSVEHAEVLALLLNRAAGGEVAAAVSSRTHRGDRNDSIARFRNGELRFLCNVGVLTTGFDAPKADVVCITRPTTSAILYEQMVGRGLRGPLNGGTKSCLVLDVQDEGLPGEIMSYARVKAQWDGTPE